MNNLLGEGSKDGNSQNIQRFSTDELGSIQTGDCAKAEAAKDIIDSAVSNISTYIDVIIKQQSSLFNKENNVKSWKANELKFYDDRMADLEAMRGKLEECETKIITNIGTLKRKLSLVNDEVSESKQKCKRLQENKRKTEVRRENRLQAKVSEVLKIITDGKVVFDDNKSQNTKIVKADLCPKKDLSPRYHLTALSHLIENKWFDDDALPVAQGILDTLTQKQELISQANNRRKEKTKQKKRQPSILSMFAPLPSSHVTPCTSMDTSGDDLDIEHILNINNSSLSSESDNN